MNGEILISPKANPLSREKNLIETVGIGICLNSHSLELRCQIKGCCHVKIHTAHRRDVHLTTPWEKHWIECKALKLCSPLDMSDGSTCPLPNNLVFWVLAKKVKNMGYYKPISPCRDSTNIPCFSPLDYRLAFKPKCLYTNFVFLMVSEPSMRYLGPDLQEC